MRRRPLLVLLTLAATAAFATPAAAFDLVRVPGTFGTAVHVTGPPHDASQIYGVGKGGRIWRYDEGAPQPVLVKDITARVDDAGEGGLLSMAFAPDFADTGRYWIFVTLDEPPEDAGGDIVVEEHDLDDPEHVAEVIRIPHPGFANHFGGQLHVGPDGHLWISTGDGGGGNDPGRNAQDPRSLLGKLLRIAPRPGGGYDIPAGNPYADGAGGAPEVWATGLRNPWRFSFDRATGDLFIGDVGQGEIEEVDRAPAPDRGPGANYGWVSYEGSILRPAYGPAPANHHAPLIEHTHDDGWFAITGGFVIRDPELCERGRYVYGDYAKSELWLADPVTGATAATDESVEQVTSFGEDAAGRVYAASISGAVYRLVREPGVTCPDPPPPSGGPGGTPPPGTTPPPGDGTTPGGLPGAPPVRLAALEVGTARRQRALRRGRLFARAACRAACTLRATGGLWVGPRRFALRRVTRRLRAAGTTTLLLRLDRRTRRALRRALRRGARPHARLTIEATSPSGDVEQRRLRISVVG